MEPEALPDTAIQKLVLDPVDHVTLDAAAGNLAAEEGEGESTPYLYLSPRVASVLRDIFSDEDPSPAVLPEVADTGTPLQAGEPQELDVIEFDEETVAAPVSKEVEDKPLIQRQMYRIDI